VSEIPGKGIESANGARLGSAEFAGGDLNSEYSLWFRDQGSKAIPIKTVERPAAGFEAFLDHAQRRQMNVSLLSGDTEKSVKNLRNKWGMLNSGPIAAPWTNPNASVIAWIVGHVL
jgi:hypothetical protein